MRAVGIEEALRGGSYGGLMPMLQSGLNCFLLHRHWDEQIGDGSSPKTEVAFNRFTFAV